jgi:flagellar biogenesis protein FliO
VNTWQTIAGAIRLAALCMASLVIAVACPAICGNLSRAGEESVPISPRGSQLLTSPADSDMASWARTSIALGITLGAVCAGLIVARRFMPGFSGGTGAGPIQILSQAPLGARGVVYVLHCGPRVLIVGATPSHLTTLAEIADPDEIDHFRQPDPRSSAALQRTRSGPMTASPTGDLKGQLHGMLDKIESWNNQS